MIRLCLFLLALLMPLSAHADSPPAPTLTTDHPLAGRIWRPADGVWLAPDALINQARAARVVLIGETHDNPDHHAVQAWLVRALAGPGIVVAFEMIDADRQAVLDNWHGPVADLGAALDWESRGWPNWDGYRPIAEAALVAGGRLAAANLPAALTRPIAAGTEPDGLARRLGLDLPLADGPLASLSEEIREGHCNMLPEAMIPAMVRVQRARDAQMAEVVAREATTAPVVLIAGSGHARTDRGVPAGLRRLGVTAPVLSIALVETDPERTDPATYAQGFHADSLPFDLVWFTGRAEREDPCARMRRHVEGKGAPR